ncbi:hypothetical protein [Desulfolucanica intricata]|uniref:hypothetical protein n=1 Tax=Desulfolucanica intricata TaxID=1285191 RepID=UPI0013520D59|nr:hypothetical protein [Desulfolucanica intricata]
METTSFFSTKVIFDCFSRDCTRLKDQGAGKLDLEPIIKAMIAEGIMQKEGELTCSLADTTCKNKLIFNISLKDI